MGVTSKRYWALWVFLIGLLVIVFLQAISGQSINRLLEGNDTVLRELRKQRVLHQVEFDLLIIESDIRGAVITSDTALMEQARRNMAALRPLIRQVSESPPEADAGFYARLTQLIDRKLSFSEQVINTFATSGKEPAEALIETGEGRRIRDSITLLISRIDNLREREQEALVSEIESGGTRARMWTFIISGIALLAVALAFWYIIRQISSQQGIIEVLNRSEQSVRQASHIKEQFMANMSHEIRTPMNAILGFTNLLRRTGLSPEQMKYVQNINSSADNLLLLINDILDLSKIEAGMMGLERAPFSLRGLVSSVEAMFSGKAAEKKLYLHTSVDEHMPDIYNGDAVRLTQVLVNLLSNAVKFTEKGGVEVEVSGKNEGKDRWCIRFVVRDTGIGIPADKQKHVFERFQQADTDTTRRFGGTGLGLSIVRQLVELQGGHLKLRSSPGTGSEFTIEIPYDRSDDEPVRTMLPSINELQRLNNVRVLIAEDNIMNQQLVRHLMKNWELDFEIVEDGAQAVQRLQQRDFSLVLMDMQMPVMDGYEATRRIRREVSSDIPIIAMTAHAMAGEKERCLSLGMNDYISKPLKESLLYNLIVQHARPLEGGGDEDHGGISLDYLHQLSGGDPEFERELLRQFLTQLPEELNALQDSIAAGDFTGVKRYAHSLKSTVGYVGLAGKLHPELDELERAAARHEPAGMEERYQRVSEACGAALEGVGRILQEGAGVRS